MKWPDEYWAKKDKAATANDWSASSKMFMDDLNELKTIVEDREIDLFLPLPHGDEYTIFREILLVADHNSYHIGQLMCLKRALE